MSTYVRSLRPLLITVAFSFFLSACGGSSSSFDETSLEPVTIDPIEADGGGEGGSEGEPTIGGSLNEEELALLPQIDIPQRVFSDPGAIVTLNAVVSVQDGANILATRWEQTSGPSVDISNITRVNTSIFVPVVDEETLLSFRLIAQDDEGRVNAATTTVVVQDVDNPLRVIGGIADEGDDSFTVSIELDEASATDTAVEYLTFDGTATAALDYTESTGSVTIPAGETQVSVDVPLMTGDLYFDAESFFFQALTLREDGTRSRSLATILIRNASPAAVIEVPELQDLPTQLFTANTVVDGVLFDNVSDNGDRIIDCVSNITLPPGLRLDITELGSSCSIVGTPLTAVEETEYMVTAINPMGESTATITIEVQADDTDVEAPRLTAELDSAVLIINEAIDPIVFFNDGGQQDIECSSELLPAGLSVEVFVDEFFGEGEGEGETETFITCRIVGTPTELSDEATYTVTASNSAGDSSATILLSVIELEAPNLGEPDGSLIFELIVGSLIDPVIALSNSGGRVDECDWTTGATVPEGLSVQASDEICIISGTPTSVGTISTFITASNSSGESSVSIDITIVEDNDLDPPVLVEGFFALPITYDLVVGEPSSSGIQYDIRGGQGDLSCLISDELPAGLTLELNTSILGFSSCEIVGVPTELSDETSYTITARNSAGQSSVELFIHIVESFIVQVPELPDESLAFNFTEGETVFSPIYDSGIGDPESLGIGSANCDWSAESVIPPGLDFSVSNFCFITGIPTSIGSFETVVVATNEIGSDSVEILITVSEPGASPILNDLEDLSFTVGEQSYFRLNNTGGPVRSDGLNLGCNALESFPVGISIADDVAGSCVVFGTPIEASEARDYAIQAEFIDDGDNVDNINASVNITVLPAPPPQVLLAPELGDAEGLVIEVSENSIDDVVFSNSGGGELSSCTSTPDINVVTPFTLAPSADDFTCVISGVPSFEFPEQEFTVTASNNIGDSSADIILGVVQVLPPNAPILNNPAATLEFTVGEQGLFELANTGGLINTCSAVDALPDGLDVATQVQDDAGICYVFGTPTEPSEATDYAIEVTFGDGEAVETLDAIINITVIQNIEPPQPPVIVSAVNSGLYTEGVAIDQIVFTNTGGDVFNCSTSPALPEGLFFSLFNLTSGIVTCSLSGTPNTALPSTAYTLSFESDLDPVELPFTIEVEAALLAPALADLPAQSFELSEAGIEDIVFSNGGGGELISCTSIPDINTVTPFTLARSNDLSTCVISGTPTSEFTQQEFTVTASNATGPSSATITLAVEEPLSAPVLSDAPFQILIVGEALDPIVFNNTGGAVESCDEVDIAPLPPGLDVQINTELGTCEIIGTPTEIVAFQIFTIEASNDAGPESADIEIGVYTAPEFAITDGTEISLNTGDNPFSEELLLSSGELDGDLECLVTPDLPDGFSFEVNANATNCELFIPTDTPLDATSYLFAARNTGAASTVPVILEVVETLVSESIEIPFSDLPGSIDIQFNWSSGDLTVDWGESEEPQTFLFSETNGSAVLNYVPDFSGLSTVTLTFTDGLSTLTRIRTSGSSIAEEPGLLYTTEILSNFENLEVLSLFNGELSGDLRDLSNLNNLDELALLDAGSMVIDVSDIPESVTNFQVNGVNNSLTGSLGDLNVNIETFISVNSESLVGNLSELSPLVNLQTLSIFGSTFIEGDIADLPDSLISYNMASTNTGVIFGDVAGLPRSLESFTLSSENEIGGNIQDFGPNLERLNVSGSNILGGDIALLQSDFITSFIVSGNNAIDTFSSNPTWTPINLDTLEISGNGVSGFSSAGLDLLLEYFANTLIANTSSAARIDIRRDVDALPSLASDEFILEIENLGYDVFVNIGNFE